MKTSELTRAALDWAVARCGGNMFQYDFEEGKLWNNYEAMDLFSPSTDWSQGGPIIERERISVESSNIDPSWDATVMCGDTCILQSGPTPLIAAMRCLVASKLGDEVEIPEELA